MSPSSIAIVARATAASLALLALPGCGDPAPGSVLDGGPRFARDASADAPPSDGGAAPRCDLATCGPPFPRIASYRIETYVDEDAEAMLSRVPLAIVDAEAHALDPSVLPRIRAANPDGELLAYLTSEEIPHVLDPKEQPLAIERFARIPPTAWLTEPGSRTSDAITAAATRIPVDDPGAFTVIRPESDFYGEDEPTFLLLESEHVRLIAIEGDELIVERGYRSVASAHPAGARIAAHVVFFAGTWMLDLATTAPADPVVGRWRDLLADEAAAMVEGGPWTGVFLDVCFEDVGFLNGGLLDVDRDGAPDDPEAASAAWSAGLGALVDTLRARLGPDVPIVANPGAQDCPHEGLDGILLEGFPIGLPEDWLAFDVGFERYRRWTSRDGRAPLSIANAFSPEIGFGTIDPEDDEIARTDWDAMRFGLAVALMGDGYSAFDNGVFGHYVAWWYDEYDGAGRGVGWLGYPLESARAIGPSAWMRELEHGLVIVNAGETAITVEVPPGFRKLAGIQDPEHNDGEAVTAPLLVAPRDGYLLVRD